MSADAADVRRRRLRLAGDPGLLAVGAVLLMCASVFPGHWRLVVLPALLLAPGYAFLRLLGRDVEWRAISTAVPVSIMIVICTALALNTTGIRLGPTSLGPVLGAVTALFLGGSYGRQLLTAQRRYTQRRLAKRAQSPQDLASEQRS